MISAADFGYDVIRRYSTYELCRCPYHTDNHPSALFFYDKAIFRCLGCKKVVNHSSGKGYVGVWSEEEVVAPPKFNLIKESVDHLNGTSFIPDKRIIDYLENERQLTMDIVDLYGVRFMVKEENRAVVFPQMNGANRCIGIVKRKVTGPDWLSRYIIEGDRVPFWPTHRFELMTEKVFVSEGAFKAMAIYQGLAAIGRPSTSVATMGSVMTEKMAILASQLGDQLIFIGDSGQAGEKFAKQFKDLGCRVFIPKIPFDDLDPTERAETIERIWGKTNVPKFLKKSLVP